ncbi:helix-turn-helix- domain containing protein AraC type [Parvibaculum lavamentivorans DS-1]|uniref:Helix-turn-helix-domain containing protein AraC type n=1 Tax=Parvibaculum lavamentivorans (strain DS-1 / DSM 13023 / NCIMB 13966) TaxID=402881 RepID=A7HP74_PARL1|nr:AraC family transcriptional regulator [Parvibaculum lavamentivorans]ABS61707.1 helix-turn-helix- domain containing protein AraC type [Parvibaculum lavamentivorans DS-1]
MRIEPGYVEIVASVLKEVGKDPAAFPLPPTGAVSEDEFRIMSENLVALADDRSIALRLGASMHLGTHGLLGHAILSSRSLRQAAGLLIQYSPLQGTKGRIHLAFTPDHAVLTFEPPFAVRGAPHFLVELFFAGVLAALRQLIGPLPDECRLELAYAPEMPEEVYRRFLGVEVSFGHSVNRFIGPNSRIDQPLSAAAIPVAEMYRLQCERLLREMNAAGGMSGNVRRMILGARGHLPALGEASRHLNMSERTLRRRLAAEGTSYRGIVDDVRNHLARGYLGETPLCVADVASLLGFDDVANFRRAFKKWNGCTPQEFRLRSGAHIGTRQAPEREPRRGEQSRTQLHMPPHHKTFV